MIERVVPAGDGWLVRVRCSQISEGDFRCYHNGGGAGGDRGQALKRRRRRLMGGEWTWLRQVHGADVVLVTEPGGRAGAVADGAVTAVPEAVLALHTADCAPVVVVGAGSLGVAHAGWRGIVAGVIGRVVDGVRRASPPGPVTELRAVIGPVIRPSSYEFGADDLAAVAAAAGRDVSGATSWGTPALDLSAAVLGALSAAGVSDVEDLGLDTAEADFFSHRVRGDRGRQATAARLERR